MKVCKKCEKEFKDAYEFCPQCGVSSITNKKIKTPTRIKNENTKFIFIGLIIIIIFMIIIINLNNSDKTKSKVKSSTNYGGISEETTEKYIDASEKSEYENIEYILKSLVENNSKLNNKYESVGITDEGDKLGCSYISKDSYTIITLKFNKNQELIYFFIIYDLKEKNSISDAYKMMSSDILSLSQYGKEKVLEILNTDSTVDKIDIDNYTMQKVTKTNLYVTVNNPSLFSDLVSK